MAKIPEIIPVSDLRQGAAAVLERLRKSYRPMVITQRGRAAAVLVSVEEYERSEREREILRLLAMGEKEIAEGKGHDLDEVMAEADALLEEGRPGGLRMNREGRIVTDPAILDGKPIVKGTRLSVELIIGLLAEGWTEARILEDYPGLTREDIAACLAYAGERLKSERVYPVPAK